VARTWWLARQIETERARRGTLELGRISFRSSRAHASL
jgi:hypothetical protein